MKMILAAVVAATALTMASSASAQAFTNGSFEQPGGSTAFIPGGNAFLPGWNVSNNDVIYTFAGTYGIAAGDGSYYLTFGANTTTGGFIEQTFDTIAGTTYVVNYLISQQQGDDPMQSLTASITGGPAVVNTGPTAFRNPFAWVAGATLTFTASGASSTLRFVDTTAPGGGGGSNIALDAVSVQAVTPGAVPEPASWAMMILGFGAIGGAMRRRGRHAAPRLA